MTAWFKQQGKSLRQAFLGCNRGRWEKLYYSVKKLKKKEVPPKRYDNDLVILHVGTNDLRHQKASKEIVKEIDELAIDTKTGKKMK